MLGRTQASTLAGLKFTRTVARQASYPQNTIEWPTRKRVKGTLMIFPKVTQHARD
jgi:hypothetical protein